MKTKAQFLQNSTFEASILALFFIIGMLLHLVLASLAHGQTQPYDYSGSTAPVYCDPLPEEPAALSECMAYYGTNGQATTYTPPADQPQTAPYDYSGSTAPANCNPLPEEPAALSECMAYYGTNGQATIHGFGGAPTTPVNPAGPGVQQPWPPAPVTTVPVPDPKHPLGFNDSNAFATMVSQIYLYALGLAAMLAVVMTVFGGYMVMTARGNASQAAKGKEYIMSSLIGMVLLMSAYLILSTINPDLVRFEL
jgi:hypothetical protein